MKDVVVDGPVSGDNVHWNNYQSMSLSMEPGHQVGRDGGKERKARGRDGVDE